MLPFAERIRTAFSELQTSPHRFANQHGLNRSSVFNILNGERRPSFDLVERICAVEPRISAEYLLRGEGDPLRNLSAPAALNTVQQLRQFQVQMNEFVESKIKELEG
ncbi:helix-turn-helix domain-containing protein [Spirosoma jeollabukense]